MTSHKAISRLCHLVLFQLPVHQFVSKFNTFFQSPQVLVGENSVGKIGGIWSNIFCCIFYLLTLHLSHF